MSGGATSATFLLAARERIVAFIRDFSAGTPKGVVVGISGGIDSALVAYLSVEALGKSRVLGVLMPSTSTPNADTDDALEICKLLGIEHKIHPIDGVVMAFQTLLSEKKDRVTVGNLKARIRMCILYWYANSMNKLVVGTDDKSENTLGFYCYDEKTRVPTTNGPKGIDDLSKDDVVFSLNPDTRLLEEVPVEKVFKFNYEGDLIHFKSRNVDLTVTPNHRMLIHPSSSNPQRLIFRTADECLKRKGIFTPTPLGWSGKSYALEPLSFSFTQRNIRRTISIAIEDILYLFGLFIGDGNAYKGSITVPVASRLSRQEYAARGRGEDGQFLKLTADAAPMMKTYPTYETAFALPYYTKGHARQNLAGILEKYGIRFSLTPDQVRISSKEIYDLFVQCGVGALNKHIPRWLLEYPSQYLVHLMKGLKDSDGSHDENAATYWTSSERLKDDFAELCVKLGRLPTVGRRPAKVVTMQNHGGKKIRTSPSYSICYSKARKEYRFIRTSKATSVRYVGRVWCPSVPPYENILVERNGKYVFSGNTKWGDGGVDFNPIGDLYKTEVRAMSKMLGIPSPIITKPSSPRLWEGHEAETELGISYTELDKQLMAKKIKDEKIKMMIKKNAHKAGDPPIPSLEDLR